MEKKLKRGFDSCFVCERSLIGQNIDTGGRVHIYKIPRKRQYKPVFVCNYCHIKIQKKEFA